MSDTPRPLERISSDLDAALRELEAANERARESSRENTAAMNAAHDAKKRIDTLRNELDETVKRRSER